MDQEVISLLKKSNALITDSHFVYTSGRHGSVYINKDALYPHTSYSSRIGELFALQNKNLTIDVVAAPALGGIILTQWTAYHLSLLKNKEILAVYTEKTSSPTGKKNQIFTRGYDALIKGKKLLIIEDLTTTGGSVKKVIKSVKQIGGKIISVNVMVNRDPDHVNSQTIGYPFSSLAEINAKSYLASACPLCSQNIPINTTLGHGKKYLSSKS